MSDTDNLELLDELMRRFDRIPDVNDKVLAMALGVAASQVSNWRSWVEERSSRRIIKKSKAEILSVLGYREDGRIEGMEWMVAKMREAIQEYETAARVRRELREGSVGSP